MDALPSELITETFRRLVWVDLLFGVQFVSRLFYALAWRSIDSLDFQRFPRQLGSKYSESLHRDPLVKALRSHPIVAHPFVAAASIRHLSFCTGDLSGRDIFDNLHALFPNLEELNIYNATSSQRAVDSTGDLFSPLEKFTKLRHLSVLGSPLPTNASSLMRLQSIQIHNFSSFGITTELSRSLCDALPYWTHLKHLFARVPIHALSHLSKLESLQCYITNEIERANFEQLRFPQLRTLELLDDIHPNRATIPSLTGVSMGLTRLKIDNLLVDIYPSLPNLHYLEVSTNYSPSRLPPLSSLEVLKLTLDQHSDVPWSFDIFSFLESASSHLRVLELNLSLEGLTKAQMEQFACLLTRFRELEVIDYYCESLYDLSIVFAGLHTLPQLSGVYCCIPGSLDAGLLAAIAAIPALSRLELNFKSSECASFTPLLQRTSFVVLSLSQGYAEEGSELLTENEIERFLERSPHLQRLDLNQLSHDFDINGIQRRFMRCEIDINPCVVNSGHSAM